MIEDGGGAGSGAEVGDDGEPADGAGSASGEAAAADANGDGLTDVARAADVADVAIVGAGAAGLACAIFAAEEAARLARPPRIVALESARRIGAKILISGGGRCNATHERVTPEDFNGARNPIRNVLAAFDVEATVRWFASLGVELKREETGKLFPVTNRAQTVVDALVARCRALGVELRTGCRVEAVRACTDSDGVAGSRGSSSQTTADAAARFEVTHARGVLRARRLVLATGGRSLPRTGSDGSGYALAQSLGHTVTETQPALVPLVLARGFFHAELRGVSQPTELATWADGKRVDRRTGSMLWTHFGISGPVALDASRHWLAARSSGARVRLAASFFPGESAEAVDARLRALAAERPRASLGRLLAGLLPERLALALLRVAGVDPSTQAAQLTREQRRALVAALTDLELPVVGPRGWDHAEVTMGGVPLAEVDYRTLASRRAPGLYLAGEILDCDGRIGGFNFQWAWATAFLAGRAAARSLAQDDPHAAPRRA
ncbi:MAG TPA: NAD(P)/FAD-dependent oxidoreductase [Candidatus Binatia bacterium]